MTGMHNRKSKGKWSHDECYALAENKSEAERMATEHFHKTRIPWKNKLRLEMEILDMEVI